MKKLTHLLVALFVCVPSLMAQDNAKYLAGAVPEIDGKVVFQKEFDLTGASQEDIYNRMATWANERMQKNNNRSRVVYEDKATGSLAAIGEEYIIFSSTALSLDRTLINYQITVTAKPGHCLMEVEKIRYVYQEKEKYTAEEWITDKYALNKTQTKLVRGLAKFRIKTIDFVEELFDDAQAALGIAKVEPIAPVSKVATPLAGTEVASKSSHTVIPVASTTSVITSAPLTGYKQIAPDRIPGNIIKMLNDDWMLITAGDKDKFNMMTASWGGLGVLYGKPVATCFINPTRYTYQLMENNDTYTLTFYTEAYREALRYCGTTSGKDADKVKGSGLSPITTPEGSQAFSEAWLIIECRKLVSQSLTPEAISNEEVKEKWAGKQLHKMYIGEIINLWVK